MDSRVCGLRVPFLRCPVCGQYHPLILLTDDNIIVCGCGTTLVNIEVDLDLGCVSFQVIPKGSDFLEARWIDIHGMDDARVDSGE